MASRIKKKKRLKNDSDSDVFIPEEPGLVSRVVFSPIVLLMLAATIGIAISGRRAWRRLPDLTKRHEYQVKAEDIHIGELPAWVPQTFLPQVVLQGALPETLSLFDNGVADKVAAAFQKHP